MSYFWPALAILEFKVHVVMCLHYLYLCVLCSTQRVLAGYTGKELFQLSNKAFTGEFGQQEGSRLVSQIKLMKTNSGVSMFYFLLTKVKFACLRLPFTGVWLKL